ncbi:MAG: hypothetical protein Q4B01_10445, partial [Eubacteriales bacterium]|nr:hypothetical protein [Eubacteriales bacterium]
PPTEPPTEAPAVTEAPQVIEEPPTEPPIEVPTEQPQVTEPETEYPSEIVEPETAAAEEPDTMSVSSEETEEPTQAPTVESETGTESESGSETESETVSEEETSEEESESESGSESESETETEELTEDEDAAKLKAAEATYSRSLKVGESLTLGGEVSGTLRNHSWTITPGNGSVISAAGSLTAATLAVTGVAAGTATVVHTYQQRQRFGGYQDRVDTYTITVENNIVRVAVFVAGRNDSGVNFSQDMLDLLNVNTLDRYGYFAAGTLELDMSRFTSTNNNAKITRQEEWDYVLGQLASNLNTSDSVTSPNNTIAQYANMVRRDLGAGGSQMKSALLLVSGAPNVRNATVDSSNRCWHLDLRFDTVQITYRYGENGLRNDNAEAGKKVFIKGATMDYTPTIAAPRGYKIVGYYSDYACSDGQEWNAVGQTINEDTTVYIKIVPQDNVVINYHVAEGQGTVTNPSRQNNPVQNGYENFNPVTGSATGSTAAPADGYHFVGWYSDQACTALVSEDPHYVPQTPDAGWTEGAEYHYYAKFERKKAAVTITKNVTGNMGDKTKAFPFSVSCSEATLDAADQSFTLKDGESRTISNLPVGAKLTLTESGNAGYGVSVTVNGTQVTGTNGSYEITVDETAEGSSNQVVVTNNKDVNPDTGWYSDRSPYLWMLSLLMLMVLGGAGTQIRRRRMF